MKGPWFIYVINVEMSNQELDMDVGIFKYEPEKTADSEKFRF